MRRKKFRGNYILRLGRNHWNNFGKYFRQTIIILITVALCFAFMLMLKDARESLYIYLTKRALSRINDLPTVDSRFYILKRIFSELIPQIALLIVPRLCSGSATHWRAVGNRKKRSRCLRPHFERFDSRCAPTRSALFWISSRGSCLRSSFRVPYDKG